MMGAGGNRETSGLSEQYSLRKTSARTIRAERESPSTTASPTGKTRTTRSIRDNSLIPVRTVASSPVRNKILNPPTSRSSRIQAIIKLNDLDVNDNRKRKRALPSRNTGISVSPAPPTVSYIPVTIMPATPIRAKRTTSLSSATQKSHSNMFENNTEEAAFWRSPPVLSGATSTGINKNRTGLYSQQKRSPVHNLDWEQLSPLNTCSEVFGTISKKNGTFNSLLMAGSKRNIFEKGIFKISSLKMSGDDDDECSSINSVSTDEDEDDDVRMTDIRALRENMNNISPLNEVLQGPFNGDVLTKIFTYILQEATKNQSVQIYVRQNKKANKIYFRDYVNLLLACKDWKAYGLRILWKDLNFQSLAKMTKVMHVVNPKGKQTTLTEIYGRRKDSTSQILFPGGVDVIGECDRPQNSDYNPLDMSVHQPQLLPVLKKNQKSVLYLPHEGEVELQPANCIGYAKLVESITYTDIVRIPADRRTISVEAFFGDDIFPNVKRLWFNGCPSWVNAEFIKQICTGPLKKKLKELRLHAPKVASNCLAKYLPRLKKLEVLALEASEHITDEVLKAISEKMDNLLELRVSDSRNITINGIKSILEAKMPNGFKALDINGTPIGDEIFTLLTKMNAQGYHLDTLLLGYMEMLSIDGLREYMGNKLNQVAPLKKVDLSDLEVEDKDLIALFEIFGASLESVTIQGCAGITISGLKRSLENNSNKLIYIDLSGSMNTKNQKDVNEKEVLIKRVVKRFAPKIEEIIFQYGE